LVFAPSLVEVEVVGLLPLVRGEVWFVSLFSRGDLLLFGYGPTPLVWGGDCIASLEVVRLREEFGTPSGLEILLGEGGDLELGARTSDYIFVFAFDPLSLNPLSFICVCASFISSYHICLCCALYHSYCLSSLYAWLVCVCLTCT